MTASSHVAKARRKTSRHVVERRVRCRRHEVVHISSDVVFPGDGVGRDEGAAMAPTSDYGRWKAAAERVVARHSGRNTIIRISLVVSIDPDDPAVHRIRSSAARGETTTWFTDEMRQPAGAEDLARRSGASQRSTRAPGCGISPAPLQRRRRRHGPRRDRPRPSTSSLNFTAGDTVADPLWYDPPRTDRSVSHAVGRRDHRRRTDAQPATWPRT